MASRHGMNGAANRIATIRNGSTTAGGGSVANLFDRPGEGRIVLMTPDQARGMLDQAGSHVVNPKAVNRLAMEMRIPSPKPRAIYCIHISEDGVAIDGFDVLTAVIKAGVPTKIRLVDPEPIEDEAMDVKAAPAAEDASCPAGEPGIGVDYEMVTPERAIEYLEKNVSNRRLRNAKVAEYAAKMKAGKWVVNHQGIAFASDGRLLDGQHRLWAIVKSGVAVKMLVARGYPVASVTSMDVGGIRNLNDMAEALTGNKYGNDFIAAARMMLSSTKADARKVDDSTRFVRYIAKHEDAIRFAIGNLTHDDVRSAVFRAVVARAYYHADRNRLETFCRVLSTGAVEGPQDTAATAFMRMFVKQRRSYFNSAGRAVLYRKLEATLRAFLRGQPLTQITAVAGEIFPLDDDKDA